MWNCSVKSTRKVDAINAAPWGMGPRNRRGIIVKWCSTHALRSWEPSARKQAERGGVSLRQFAGRFESDIFEGGLRLTDDARLPEFRLDKSRLATLLDGVFAIAMTLMVLEIKLPELQDRRSLSEFTQVMAGNGWALVSFLISIGVLGFFWYRHHRQYSLIDHVDAKLLAINLLFLACVAFFPFAAGVIGRYPGNPGVFFVYMPSVLMLVVCLSLQWAYARDKGLLDPHLDPAAAGLIHRGNLAGCAGAGLVTLSYVGFSILQIKGYVGPHHVSLCVIPLLPFFWWRRRMRRRHGI